MAQLSDLIEELQALSTQISFQVRTVALSLLALSWGLLVGVAPAHLQILADIHVGLIRVGLLAVLALLIDFAQYIFGYLHTLGTLRASERAGKKEATYDTGAVLYRLRNWMFWSKIWVTLGASFYLFFLLLPRVL